MRGTSKDVINTMFTIIFAFGIFFAIYLFGTTIFMRGSKITVSAFEAGGCACVDAAPNAEITCGGQKIICKPCSKVTLGCHDTQEMNLKSAFGEGGCYAKKIRVCTNSGGSPIIYLNDLLIGSTESGQGKCIEKEFEQSTSIDKLKAIAGVGQHTDRLTLEWDDCKTQEDAKVGK